MSGFGVNYSNNMKIPSYASVRHLKDIFMPPMLLLLLCISHFPYYI